MASKKIKVSGKEDLVRDSFSKAIINTNRNDYILAKNRKKIAIDRIKKIESLESEIALLKANQEEILKLFHSLKKK